MKKWPWLFLFPYVVIHSTSTVAPYFIPLSSDGVSWACAETSKDFCYDLAESLNNAHERRLQKEDVQTSRPPLPMSRPLRRTK